MKPGTALKSKLLSGVSRMTNFWLDYLMTTLIKTESLDSRFQAVLAPNWISNRLR